MRARLPSIKTKNYVVHKDIVPVFTETEKTHIREQIAQSGRAHFAAQGLKKTSIEDLTRPAGIAKSSFYAFFDSKEELYLELLMAERRRMAEELSAALPVASDAREAIACFLRAVVRKIEDGALTRRVITHPEEWRMVLRRVSAERMEANIAESTLVTLSFIRKGQESGEIIEASPEVIAGLVRAVVTLTTHKDDIGKDIYPEVLEMMIGFVAAGLTGGGGGGA
jgi:AcrR family transcriptional regulator